MAKGKVLSKKDEAEICLRVNKGESKKEIAKEYGISYNRVQRCYTTRTMEESNIAFAEIIENPSDSEIGNVVAMATTTREAAIKEIYRRLTSEEWVNRIKPADLVKIVDCMNSIVTTGGANENRDAIALMEHLRSKSSLTYITDDGKAN